MICHRHDTRQGGVTLIEVLIALLIFSFGLVGIAGLLVMATSANHSGYQRTQVEYLAQNMADRMSANPVGVWDKKYNGSYPVSGTPSCGSGCDPTALATYDKQQWSRQLEAFLPDVSASIECDKASGFAPSAADLLGRPPYSGQCSMSISWRERGIGAASEREAGTQTYYWEFEP